LDFDILLADRFAVSHLWLTNVCLDIEFALHAVNQDFEVQLTHTGDDGLPSLLVGVDAEGRVFFS
jgi:hypothetical protein